MPENMQENDEQQYIESTIGSYCEYIEKDIPELIKKAYEKLIGDDLSDAIHKIVMENIVDETRTGIQNYRFISSVSAKNIDKHRKKQRYHCNALRNKLEADYIDVMSGASISDPSSCFSEMVINTLIAMERRDRSDIIDNIYTLTSDWLKMYIDLKNPERTDWIEKNIGFCAYPYFHLIEANDKTKAKKMILIDLEDAVFRLSEMKYKDFNIYSPKSILREGFVNEGQRRNSKIRESYDLQLLSKTGLRKTFFDEEENAEEVNIISDHTWDYQDFMIFNYLCTKCIRNLNDISGVLTVTGSLTEICSTLFPNVKSRKYNSSHYETAKERLTNVFNTRVSAKINGKEAGKALFDYYVIDDPKTHQRTDDPEINKIRESLNKSEKKGSTTILFQATFGRRITGDIVNSRLETIIRPQIESISGEIAKMLFMSLKNDRISDVYFYNQRTRIFTLDNFMIIIRLADRKAKRMQRYAEALQELKSKGLLIENFRLIDDTFEVTWLPLSGQEKTDITIIPAEYSISENE